MKSLLRVEQSPWWRVALGIAGVLAFWLLARAQFVPLPLRVAGLWGLWLLLPGAMVRAGAWWDEAPILARLGSMLLVSSAWNLLVLDLVQLTGGGLHRGLLILSITWPFLGLLSRARLRFSLRLPSRGGILPLLLAGALLIHLGRQTPQLRLDSDVPAHLGTIHDALAQDRWLPRDDSFPDAPDASDPRMGLLHGMHAALAQALDADPARVWGLAGGVLSLAFLVGFAWLFLEWGLSSAWALVAALFFALGVGGGAPLGVWGAVYPAQFALSLAAASGAWFLRSSREKRDGLWWIGAFALGISVLVHPFAWWGMVLVMAHLLVLSLLLRGSRAPTLRIARYLAVSGLLGGGLLLPSVLGASGTSGQWEQAGILRFGNGLFTIDPLIVLRWSGMLSPLAIVFVLWRWRRWKQSLPGLFVVASALPLWTITLDPLVQPFVFSHVGYLSERLGLFAAAPAMLLFALMPRRGKAWSPSRKALVGAVLAGMLVTAWPRLETSPYRGGAIPPASLAALREAVATVEGPVLTDPRTSYALRGMGSGTLTLLPVAHASPLDASIERRTEWYRSILAEECTPPRFERALDELGASALLLVTGVEREYRGASEYGFVASDRRQRRLRERLTRAGHAPRAQGDGWALFDCAGLTLAPGRKIADSGDCEGRGRSVAERRATLRIVSLGLTPRKTSRGDSLVVTLCYDQAVDSIANPGWSRVQLRFLGPHAPVPRFFARVSKVYRKLIQEKSLRSPSRFTVAFVPNDGYPRFEAAWGESRTVVIPSGMEAGQYEVLASVAPEHWRPVRSVADYLDDRARWSGKSLGRVIVQSRERTR